MGIFAWELLVKPVKHFSALAGGIALGAMMIPMVTRTTEEMVRLVPISLREAALALGYSRWRTSLSIVLRTALGGIVTGALVAMARIAGETAPLLFTALGNQFWSTSLRRPIAALPLQIFNYAISPYDEWHRASLGGRPRPRRHRLRHQPRRACRNPTTLRRRPTEAARRAAPDLTPATRIAVDRPRRVLRRRSRRAPRVRRSHAIDR